MIYKKNSIKKKELLKIRVFLCRGSSARPRYLETLQPWYPVNKAVQPPNGGGGLTNEWQNEVWPLGVACQ